MKGTFFQQPLEWNLNIEGEAWVQGATLKGVLLIKNHGKESLDLADCGVALAVGEIKKVHARDEKALKYEQQKTLQATDLIAPGESKELIFSFSLSPNCFVTDKRYSYFISCGKNFQAGHLQLKIEPAPLYGKVINLLDTFLRFKIKEIKSGKKGVEYKLLPPTSREFANVEHLTLGLAQDGENLNFDFDFQVKKLDTNSITNKLSKENTKISKVLSPREFMMGKEHLDQDKLLKFFTGVFSEVKLNPFLDK